MSNTKIVIDKEDFQQKIIGWIERRNYVTKSDILALFQDLTTEIQIDQSIEERAENKYPKKISIIRTHVQFDENSVLRDKFIEGAISENLIWNIKIHKIAEIFYKKGCEEMTNICCEQIIEQ